MSCDNCKSERILNVGGKTSDMFNAQGDGIDHDGYVPTEIGIASKNDYGDYINFIYCLECGKIQGHFPISDETVKKSFADA